MKEKLIECKDIGTFVHLYVGANVLTLRLLGSDLRAFAFWKTSDSCARWQCKDWEQGREWTRETKTEISVVPGTLFQQPTQQRFIIVWNLLKWYEDITLRAINCIIVFSIVSSSSIADKLHCISRFIFCILIIILHSRYVIAILRILRNISSQSKIWILLQTPFKAFHHSKDETRIHVFFDF